MRVRAGLTIHRALKTAGVLSAASRMGVEKREGASWSKIPVTYRLKDGDTVRVAYPKQAKSSSRLPRLLTELMGGVRARTRDRKTET